MLTQLPENHIYIYVWTELTFTACISIKLVKNDCTPLLTKHRIYVNKPSVLALIWINLLKCSALHPF